MTTKIGFKTPEISTGVGVIASTERGVVYAARKGASALGHSVPYFATGALAVLSIFDQRLEKKNITDHYRSEIAARVGKPVNKVTVADMEQVAKENPVIAAAVKRTTKQRNLNIGLAAVGIAAAVALINPVGGALAFVGLTTGLAASLAHIGLIAGISYFAVEKPLEEFGKKKLGLEEPEPHAVHKNPALQAELSVPSQIKFLAELQAHNRPVTQAQVASVIVSANPELEAKIKEHFGVNFTKLPASAQTQVITDLSKQHGIAELTDAINNRSVRAQELAFAAHGQASGVVGAAERQQRLAELNAELDKQEVARFYAPEPGETQQSVFRQREVDRRAAQQSAVMGAA